MALSSQQKKFCENLVSGMSQSDAYKKAGYKPKSVSAVTTSSSKLMTNVDITEYLNYLQEKSTKKTIMNRTEVLLELSRLGRANIANLVKWTDKGVKYKKSEELSEEDLISISEISGGKNVPPSLKINQSNKIKALELLAKHHGALIGSDDSDDSGDKKSIQEKVLKAIRKL